MRIALLSTSRDLQAALLQALAQHTPANLHIHCLNDWPTTPADGGSWDCVFLLPATAAALLQAPSAAGATEMGWRTALLEAALEWRVLYGGTAAQARAVQQALAEHGLLPEPEAAPASTVPASAAQDTQRLRWRNCEDCVDPGCERRLFSSLLDA